ncbi:metal ABC transporter ATP-binding protein [Candidatus Roizmanbacteria bacterium]|nr:metal ABC transporter ATP-binding protein [Candidatus Roizmanbacteria bacterium]
MSTVTEPLIEVSNLYYAYNDTPVLDHISFSIEKGSYVGIIGPNGGGKTTLLKILLGLLQPKSGTVRVLSKSVSDLKDKYRIGYVPQRVADTNIQFPATVQELVESGLTPKKPFFGTLSLKDKKRIEEVMHLARIEPYKNRLISKLSGGERQRVYVARALVSEPQILLLDEPFVGIDVASQNQFYTLLQELNTKEKLTILFVSHDIDVISSQVKQLLCLNKRIVCKGEPQSILESEMVEELYGKKVTHLHHE